MVKGRFRVAPKPALIHDCLQSGRQDVHLGTLFQDRFPDLVAAAARLPPGLFLDGELLALTGGGGWTSGRSIGVPRPAPSDGTGARACVPGV